MTRSPHPVVVYLLKRVWALRLKLRAGFHDLENLDDPDGPLSNAGQPSHLDTTSALEAQQAASYYRRLGQLAGRLPFARDQAIAEALADGLGIRTIKSKLSVGQGRIERVMYTLRSWLPEKNWAEPEERETA